MSGRKEHNPQMESPGRFSGDMEALKALNLKLVREVASLRDQVAAHKHEEKGDSPKVRNRTLQSGNRSNQYEVVELQLQLKRFRDMAERLQKDKKEQTEELELVKAELEEVARRNKELAAEVEELNAQFEECTERHCDMNLLRSAEEELRNLKKYYKALAAQCADWDLPQGENLAASSTGCHSRTVSLQSAESDSGEWMGVGPSRPCSMQEVAGPLVRTQTTTTSIAGSCAGSQGSVGHVRRHRSEEACGRFAVQSSLSGIHSRVQEVLGKMDSLICFEEELDNGRKEAKKRMTNAEVKLQMLVVQQDSHMPEQEQGCEMVAEVQQELEALRLYVSDTKLSEETVGVRRKLMEVQEAIELHAFKFARDSSSMGGLPGGSNFESVAQEVEGLHAESGVVFHSVSMEVKSELERAQEWFGSEVKSLQSKLKMMEEAKDREVAAREAACHEIQCLMEQICELKHQNEMQLHSGSTVTSEDSIETILKEKMELSEQVVELREALSHREKEIHRVKDELAVTTSRIASIEQSRGVVLDKHGTFPGRDEEMQSELSRLLESCSVLDKHVRELVKERDQTNEECCALESKVRDLTVERERSRKEGQDLKDQLADRSMDMENVNAHLKEELSFLKEKLSLCEKENGELVQKVAEAEGKLVDVERSRDEVLDRANYSAELEGLTVSLREDVIRLNEQMKLAEQEKEMNLGRAEEAEGKLVELGDMQQLIADLKDQMANRSEEVETVRMNLTEELRVVRGRLEIVENDNARLRGQVEEAEGVLEKKEREVKRKASAHTQVSGQLWESQEDLKTLRAEYDTLLQEFNSQQQEFEAQKREFNSQKQEFEAYRIECTQLETTLETCRGERQKALSLADNFRTEYEELKAQWETDVTEKQALVDTLNVNSSELKVEKSRAERLYLDCTDLKKQIVNLEGKVSSLEEKCEGAKEGVSILTGEKSALLDELSAAKDENDGLMNASRALHEEVEATKKELVDLRTLAEDIEEEKWLMEEAMADLEEQNNDLREQLGLSVVEHPDEDEYDDDDDLQDLSENGGLVIQQRELNLSDLVGVNTGEDQESGSPESAENEAEKSTESAVCEFDELKEQLEKSEKNKSELEKLVEELQGQIEALEKNEDKLEDLLGCSNMERADLEEDLRLAKKDNDDLNEELGQCAKKRAELSEELIAVQVEKTGLQEKVDRLQKDLGGEERTLYSLKTDLQRVSAENRDLHGSVVDLTNESARLRREVNATKKLAKDQAARLKAAKDELKLAKENNDMDRREVGGQKVSYAEIQEKLELYQSQMKNLEASTVDLESEKQVLADELEVARDEVRKLSELVGNETELHSKECEAHEETRGLLREKEEELVFLTGQIDELRGEVARMESEMESVSGMVGASNPVLHSAPVDYEDLQRSHSESVSRVHSLERSLADAGVWRRKIEQALDDEKKESERMSQSYNEVADKLEQSQEALHRLEEEMSAQQCKSGALNTELVTAKTEIDTLQTKLADSKTHADELAAHLKAETEKVSTLECEVKLKERAIEQLTGRVNQAEIESEGLNTELNLVKSKMDAVSSERDVAKKDLKIKNQELEEMSQRLQIAEQREGGLELKLEESNDIVADLTRQLEQVTCEVDVVDGGTREYTVKSRDLKMDFGMLKRGNDKEAEGSGEMSKGGDAALIEKEKSELESKLEANIKEVAELNASLTKAMEEREEGVEEILRLRLEIGELQQHIDALEATASSARTSQKKLEQDIQEAEARAAEMRHQLDRSRAEHLRKINELTTMAEAAEEQRTAMEIEAKSLTETNSQLEEKLTQAQARVVQLESDLWSTVTEKDTLATELNEAKAALAEQIREHVETTAGFESALETAQHQFAKLEEAMEKFREESEEKVVRERARAENLEDEYRGLKDTADMLSSEKVELQVRIAEANSTKEDLELALETQKRENGEMKNYIEELNRLVQNAEDGIDRLNTCVESLTEERNSLTDELTASRDAHDIAVTELQAVVSEKEALAEHNSSLGRQISALQSEIANCMHTQEAARKLRRNLDDMTANLEEERSRSLEIVEENSRLGQRIGSLQDRIAELVKHQEASRKVQMLEEKVSSLEHEKSSVAENLEQVKSDLEMQVIELERHRLQHEMEATAIREAKSNLEAELRAELNRTASEKMAVENCVKEYEFQIGSLERQVSDVQEASRHALDDLQSSLECAQLEKRQNEQRIAEYMERIASYEEKMVELKEREEGLQGRLDDALQTRTELEGSVADLSNRVAMLEKDNSVAGEECDRLVEKLDDACNAKMVAENRIMDLEEQLVFLNMETEQSKASLVELSKDLEAAELANNRPKASQEVQTSHELAMSENGGDGTDVPGPSALVIEPAAELKIQSRGFDWTQCVQGKGDEKEAVDLDNVQDDWLECLESLELELDVLTNPPRPPNSEEGPQHSEEKKVAQKVISFSKNLVQEFSTVKKSRDGLKMDMEQVILAKESAEHEAADLDRRVVVLRQEIESLNQRQKLDQHWRMEFDRVLAEKLVLESRVTDLSGQVTILKRGLSSGESSDGESDVDYRLEYRLLVEQKAALEDKIRDFEYKLAEAEVELSHLRGVRESEKRLNVELEKMVEEKVVADKRVVYLSSQLGFMKEEMVAMAKVRDAEVRLMRDLEEALSEKQELEKRASKLGSELALAQMMEHNWSGRSHSATDTNETHSQQPHTQMEGEGSQKVSMARKIGSRLCGSRASMVRIQDRVSKSDASAQPQPQQQSTEQVGTSSHAYDCRQSPRNEGKCGQDEACGSRAVRSRGLNLPLLHRNARPGVVRRGDIEDEVHSMAIGRNRAKWWTVSVGGTLSVLLAASLAAKGMKS